MEIKVDRTVYSLEALLKTAYHFVEDAYIHLSHNEESWIIQWISKEDCTIDPESFENELIIQQLRFQLIERTAELRKLILARAFASTMIDTEQEATETLSFHEETCGEQLLKGWFDGND